MFDSSLLFFHLLLFLRLVCTPPESDGIPYLSGQKNQINNVVDGTILIPCIILNTVVYLLRISKKNYKICSKCVSDSHFLRSIESTSYKLQVGKFMHVFQEVFSLS